MVLSILTYNSYCGILSSCCGYYHYYYFYYYYYYYYYYYFYYYYHYYCADHYYNATTTNTTTITLQVPKATDRVVYLAGAWDMFHAGHIAILEQARQYVLYCTVPL